MKILIGFLIGLTFAGFYFGSNLGAEQICKQDASENYTECLKLITN